MKASVPALVFGYFGAGNFGDEWTLAAFLAGCRQFGCPLAPVVLSRNPAATAAEHGVPAVPRRWRALSSALARCRWVIGCGGSLLQDATSLRSLVFYSALVAMAHLAGKKVALLAQGLGPLRRPVSRALAWLALRVSDCVTFRDAASARMAERLGAVPRPATVTADLTFAWDALPPVRPAFCLGVNLRPVRAASLSRTIAEGVSKWMARQTGQVLLLPLQRGADEEPLQVLASRVPARWWQGRRWQDMLDGIAQVRALLAVRLHGLIAAALLGVPFVGVAYDPKVAGIFQAFAERLLPMDATVDALCGALDLAVGDTLDAWRERVAPFVAAERTRAVCNFTLLRERLDAEGA